MKSLVVFDSQFGNTEKIARQITETLGEFGTARAVQVTDCLLDDLKGTDLLVLGCPTQAWHSTEHMQNFLKQLEHQPLEHLCVAEFDTRLDKPTWITGSAARGMAKQLKHVGAQLLPPESFMVTGREGPLEEGELDHAAQWARALHDEFQAQARPAPATA